VQLAAVSQLTPELGRSTQPVKEYLMKKLLLMSAILLVAACGERKAAEAPPAETTGEMAAPGDTGMGMSHDTSMTHSDTTMARDTAK
jgi:hypothetical protein